jgi:ABC-type lipoprotein export system ATPase subunit
VFYGRERLAAELAAKTAARAACGGLVVVTGASGSGKSSLLRAGLLPMRQTGPDAALIDAAAQQYRKAADAGHGRDAAGPSSGPHSCPQA